CAYSCWLSCSARSPIHRIKLIPKYPVKSRRMRPFTKKLCVGLLLGDEKPWRVTSVQQCSAPTTGSYRTSPWGWVLVPPVSPRLSWYSPVSQAYSPAAWVGAPENTFRSDHNANSLKHPTRRMSRFGPPSTWTSNKTSWNWFTEPVACRPKMPATGPSNVWDISVVIVIQHFLPGPTVLRGPKKNSSKKISRPWGILGKWRLH